MAHTRIAEMAAYHIGKIRSVQPSGPYLLGGDVRRRRDRLRDRPATPGAGGAGGHASPCSTRPTRRRRPRPGGWPASGSGVSPACSGRAGRPARAAGLATILGKASKKASEPGDLHGRASLGRARGEVRHAGCSAAWLDRGRQPLRGPGQDPRADRLPVRRAGLPARRPVRRGAGAVPGHRRHRPRRALHRTLRRSPAGLGPARRPEGSERSTSPAATPACSRSPTSRPWPSGCSPASTRPWATRPRCATGAGPA